MESDLFLNTLKNSFAAIDKKRFFNTERGYQGQLLTQLDRRFRLKKILVGGVAVEQEYQKTLKKHGITIRPDIIIHVPYKEEIHTSPRSGNFVVIQLKLNASKEDAIKDFKKMDLMFNKLDYPLGIFLNINSNKTFFDSYSGDYKDRLHCFAVRLSDNKVLIYESP